MKVLQVNVDGWFYGRPMYVCKLARLLKDTGVDCKIVGGTELFEKELERHGIQNIRIFNVWKALDRSICSLINLYRIIKNEKPDVIHAHGTSENIIMGMMKPLLKIPVVVTYHTNPFDKYKNERSITNKIKRYIYELFYLGLLTKLVARNFAYITVISKELEKSFIQQRFKKNKIKVVYFGIDNVGNDVRLRSRRGEETNIIFIGRVSVDKGCDCLLRACKTLAGRGKRFMLYLVGGGDTDYFSDMATRFGIKDRIVFTGFQREITEFLMSADFFVLPSKGEGLPISILEAMAYGLPIIATNVGGIPELIEEGKNGFLVPPGDEVSLANAIGKMIEIGGNGRYVMGLENKEKIERLFSSKKMVRSYHNIYRKAIAHSMVTQ